MLESILTTHMNQISTHTSDKPYRALKWLIQALFDVCFFMPNLVPFHIINRIGIFKPIQRR